VTTGDLILPLNAYKTKTTAKRGAYVRAKNDFKKAYTLPLVEDIET